ncbi:MAG: O-antigen ligase family protein [Fibrobacterota bacterium]|nr:O-antigen ligase family protein [Fibrobacterota bacterium]
MFTAYATVSLLAVFLSINPYEGVNDWSKTALMAVFLWQSRGIMAATGAVRTRRILAKTMIVFGLVAACGGLVELHGLGDEARNLEGLYGIKGTFAHKNLFSDILFLSLPFSLFAVLRMRRAWRFAGVCSLASGLVVIFLLQTRSVWLALAVSSLAGGILALICPDWAPDMQAGLRGKWKQLLLAATCSVLVLGIMTSFHGSIPVGMHARLTSSFDPSQNQWRLMLWEKSLRMSRDHPWIGVGPGNWKIEFPRYGTDDIRVVGGEREGTETEFVRPHNDFIWVLCETGLAGGILYLSFFLGLLATCARSRILSPDGEAGTYFACIFMGIMGYMVDAAFSFPRERIAHSAFLVLMAASILAFPGTGRKVERDRYPESRMFLIRNSYWAVLSLAILAVAWGWIRLDSEKSMRQALNARAESRWEDVVASIAKVDVKVYPLDAFGNPVMFYSGTASFLLGDRKRAKAAFEDAMRSHPFHAHNLNNLGTLMEQAGDHAKAIDLYERALYLRPGFEEVLLNCVSVHYNRGDYDRARIWFSKCPPRHNNPRWKKISTLLDSLGK